MLEVSQLAVSYDGSRILRGVNLTVPDRSLVCLMGRNGVGKTTTLKSIIGLVRADTGTINLDGADITTAIEAGPARPRGHCLCRRRTGRYFSNLTVWENLKISLVVHGASKPTDNWTACSGIISRSERNVATQGRRA